MQARARRLERKMEDDKERRMLRYLVKYITKVDHVKCQAGFPLGNF